MILVAEDVAALSSATMPLIVDEGADGATLPAVGTIEQQELALSITAGAAAADGAGSATRPAVMDIGLQIDALPTALVLTRRTPAAHAVAALTVLAAGAPGVAVAAMVVIGVRVDAFAAAFGSLGAATLPTNAGEIPIARVVAASAMLLVVVGIDAKGATEDLVAGAAAALALPSDTGDVVAAGAVATAAVPGVRLSVDAGVAALDRAVLAWLRFLFPLSFLLRNGPGGETEVGPEAKRGQQCSEPTAAQGAAELACQTIEALTIHANLRVRGQSGTQIANA